MYTPEIFAIQIMCFDIHMIRAFASEIGNGVTPPRDNLVSRHIKFHIITAFTNTVTGFNILNWKCKNFKTTRHENFS